MKTKRKWIAAFLGLLGVLVLAYPALSDAVSRVNGSYAIQQLTQQMARTNREELRIQREKAESYNASLCRDPEDSNISRDYEQILDFGNGIMGYIRIPKIHVELPIYHTAEESVLVKGVGHLPQSAFPIGGAGNHSVLSGHTGLPEAKLFTDLDKLELGDLFYIHILEEDLVYRVDQIKIVLPSQGEDLQPREDQDLCTLVTCTPYGINSHRLLVRGVRTETGEAASESPAEDPEEEKRGWLWLAVPVSWLPAAVLFVQRRKKER